MKAQLVRDHLLTVLVDRCPNRKPAVQTKYPKKYARKAPSLVPGNPMMCDVVQMKAQLVRDHLLTVLVDRWYPRVQVLHQRFWVQGVPKIVDVRLELEDTTYPPRRLVNDP
jgi:hypothetical protein